MRTRNLTLYLIVSIVCLATTQCRPDDDAVYEKLREYADGIRVVDTHSHMHFPEEYGDHQFSVYHLIAHSYLLADLISAGSERYDLNQLDTITPGDFWDKYGCYLDYCRNTSYYGHLIKGFQKLYDFEDLSFTESNISSLASLVEGKYRDNESWFDEAFNKAGFELMFLCTGRFTIPLDMKYYVVSYYINNLVTNAGRKPATGDEPAGVYKDAAADDFIVSDLDSYLDYCDLMFKKYIDNRGVCIKNSLAYSRTLYYEDVPYDEARRLYSRPSEDLSRKEVKKIEDFMFHWLIRKAVEYDLPVQIHTGYLANNGGILENSMPLKLTNLLLLYPKAKFILFHGGFPWTGEFASLGKMFPNVYLDLVWLPQISREEAVQSLDMMLDCVPYNKFFWGGDCNNIEGETGALEYGKDVVSEVLAKRVKRGVLTEEVAKEIIDRIFRGNAIELFKLDRFLDGEI